MSSRLQSPAVRAEATTLLPSEERFRWMVENVKDYAIFMLDEKGYVQTWNAGAQIAKGYTSSEIIGKHLSVFYPPEEVADGKPLRLLKRAVEEGRVEDEGWRVRRDGTRFWADVIITALFDDNRVLRGFAKVTRDLTQRRQSEDALRQSEERFRILVQSVQDHAIFMLDVKGHVSTWNSGAQRITGYTPEEIMGQHFSKFYPPADVANGKCERELETALTSGKFDEEGWRLRKDGSTYWSGVVIEPLRDRQGTLMGFAKVTRDLTARKLAEEERLHLAQAQEAIRLRDDFLSIASHELKTPLSALLLQLQGILHSAKTSKAQDEKTQQRAERAFKSARRLADLVETLMDVSRIATGRFSLTPTQLELVDLANAVVDRFQEQAASAGCTLTVKARAPIEGTWDRSRVDQILTNLIGNALKYAPGTHIEVALIQEGPNALLTVTDGGPGITPSERERIFRRFERAVSMRHYGGLGLGLYVARELAEAHGGFIQMMNISQGAQFQVTLPLSPPP